MVEMRREPLPAAWARDPFGRYPHRLFDGRAWTDRVARGGRTLSDTFLMGSPSPTPELLTTCDECGFDVGDAKFCPRCGTPGVPPARPPYCYQCSSNPPPGATFCHECGSRLDALAPGLSVRDADEWRRIFGLLGWRKDAPDVDRAYRDAMKKPSRRGANLPALLRGMELPAFDGEDPSEPWLMWIAMPDQRRTAWLTATGVEASLPGADGPAKVETLIVTRCRIVALSPGGLTSPPSLVFTDSLANVSESSVGNGTLRLRFASADRELGVGWRVSNRPSPLTPADLRSLAAGGPGPAPNATNAPMRRATDRRDGGRYVAEAALDAFARQLAAISG
ncbi:MAG: zinc ribbon domain-containing protein [Acidimicrobiia bacterium]